MLVTQVFKYSHVLSYEHMVAIFFFLSSYLSEYLVILWFKYTVVMFAPVKNVQNVHI